MKKVENFSVPAEHHSASDVLSLSILPLMPNEKMALINFQATRARISLYPEVAANLCKKAKTGNDAKFLVVAVNFLSKYDDQEQLRVMHSMPDTVQDLYSSMIFPFLEQVMGEKAMQHLLGAIETTDKYGLTLNKDKCVAIRCDEGAPIKLLGNKLLKVKDQATYLGCELSKDTDLHKELGKKWTNVEQPSRD